MTNYQSLYRAWRPHRFSDMVGQEATRRMLRNQARTGHVAHAYLFCGSHGTGKTSAARIMARVREMRGGRDYDSRFGVRMKGEGTWAELLGQRFARACKRLGMNRAREGLRMDQFRPPALDGQQALF